MAWIDRSARRVLDAYRDSGPRARMHTAARWLTSPMPEVERLVPRAGQILDLGCGHGLLSLWLADRSDARTVFGCDIDDAKIRIARRAAKEAGWADRIRFESTDLDAMVAGSGVTGAFDSIVVCDVLYLLGQTQAEDLLGRAVQRLAPNGVVVIKEMGAAPQWKVKVNENQERLLTGVLGLTAGDTVEVLDLDVVSGWLRGHGLSVRPVDLSAGYPHPHAALVATAGEG